MSENNYWPAFPGLKKVDVSETGYLTADFEKGMSLRDYFAAKAMSGLVIIEIYIGGSFTEEEHEKNNENIAKMSYNIADAMIRERDKNNE